MRRSLLALALFALFPVLALSAAASCEVLSVGQYWDINYVTVCALDEGGFGDGTQEFNHDYLLHARHAAEADPVFTFWEANVARGTWTYDDGEVQHQREWVQIGSGLFLGARGLVGGGYHLYLDQRDQTAPEGEGAGYCSSHTGRSTCFGGGAWLTIQPVTSVGGALYYHQVNDTGSCEEQGEVDLDILGVYVPVPTDPAPCSAEMPWLYDQAFWDSLPPL